MAAWESTGWGKGPDFRAIGPTIDGEDLAGDESGAAGGQEYSHGGNVLGDAGAGDGLGGAEPGEHFGGLPHLAVEVGDDEAGGDGIDGDAVLAPFGGEGAREAGERALGHAVDGDEGNAIGTEEAGDVEDTAALAAGDHVGADALGEAGDAMEVGGEDVVVFLFGVVLEAFADIGATDVDEDGVGMSGGGLIEALGVFHVEGKPSGIPAGVGELGGFGREGRAGAGGEDGSRASGGESAGDGEADTAAGAGDEGGLAFEGEGSGGKKDLWIGGRQKRHDTILRGEVKSFC